MYNKKLARFFNVDPITAKYPELTPFQFASNSPIQNIDIDGLEGSYFSVITQLFESAGITKTTATQVEKKVSSTLSPGYPTFSLSGNTYPQGGGGYNFESKNPNVTGSARQNGSPDRTVDADLLFATLKQAKTAAGSNAPPVKITDIKSFSETLKFLNDAKKTGENLGVGGDFIITNTTNNTPAPTTNQQQTQEQSTTPKYSYSQYSSAPNQDNSDTTYVIKTDNATGQKDTIDVNITQ